MTILEAIFKYTHIYTYICLLKTWKCNFKSCWIQRSFRLYQKHLPPSKTAFVRAKQSSSRCWIVYNLASSQRQVKTQPHLLNRLFYEMQHIILLTPVSNWFLYYELKMANFVSLSDFFKNGFPHNALEEAGEVEQPTARDLSGEIKATHPPSL